MLQGLPCLKYCTMTEVQGIKYSSSYLKVQYHDISTSFIAFRIDAIILHE
jgi:hypothetical protein